jgi:hypothetical protein
VCVLCVHACVVVRGVCMLCAWCEFSVVCMGACMGVYGCMGVCMGVLCAVCVQHVCVRVCVRSMCVCVCAWCVFFLLNLKKSNDFDQHTSPRLQVTDN